MANDQNPQVTIGTPQVSYNEGDVATNDNGDELVYKKMDNGQLNWVPTVKTDIEKDIVPAILRTASNAVSLGQSAIYMGAKGVDSLGDYAFPDWNQSAIGQGVQTVEKGMEPYTAAGTTAEIEKHTGPLYQPQRLPTQIGEAALQSAPYALLGDPEQMIPNTVRALLSGGASEAAGQATAGTGWETPARLAAGAAAYGVPGSMLPRSTAVTTPLQRDAQVVEDAGVPVSAAQRSGSRLTSTLEGGEPPAGQAGAVSDAILRGAQVTRPPGNFEPWSALAQQRSADLGQEVQGLEANTVMPNTPDLQNSLRQEVTKHYQGAASPSDNQAVSDAIKEYNGLVSRPAGMWGPGNGLSGQQYNDLRGRWASSNIPALRAMAGHLDEAMDNATANGPYAGAWDAWRQKWADLQGAKAGIDAAGGGAVLKQPLSPDVVVNAMYKRTPMRDMAQASQGILANYPPAYGMDPRLSSILGAAAGAGAGYAGHNEPATWGILGSMVGPAASYLSKPVAGAFRSASGQRFLRNFDPNVVAALMADQGVQPKPGAAPQQPQGSQ